MYYNASTAKDAGRRVNESRKSERGQDQGKRSVMVGRVRDYLNERQLTPPKQGSCRATRPAELASLPGQAPFSVQIGSGVGEKGGD